MQGDKADLPDMELKPQGTTRQGGFRAANFIFFGTGLESMGFIANMASMFLYFKIVMLFDLAGAANTLTNFLGSTFLLALLGGFISDTYLTRLTTCLSFGLLEVLALTLVTIQAHYTKLHPNPCPSPPCIKGGQAVMFYTSLALLAIGAGGVRGSLPALGGDQFNANDEKERKSLATFFNFLLLSNTLGAVFGVTFIVYLSTQKSWDIGFFICMLGACVGFIVVTVGKPFYRVQPPGDSPIIQIVKVIVVAIRNRSLSLPEDPDELHEVSDKEITLREKAPHTHQFRFLDKAAILSQETTPEPWRVCTVTQVEEVKILTRMLPIIASTILMNTCLAQLQTFSVQQGYSMDRNLGNFVVPTPSIPVIPLLFMCLLVPIYEYLFIPFARKITHHPSGITQLQRVGVGLVLSAISMTIAGFIEVKRRDQSMKDFHHPISFFWLSLQYGIFGIADMFTLVGLMEFFYKEAPSGMRSLSTSFTFLSLSMGYFLSSVFVSIINSITGSLTENKKGWLEGEFLDEINLDLFYWFLAILSCVNFANYLFWARWYKYKPEDSSRGFEGSKGILSHKEDSIEISRTTQSSVSNPDQAKVTSAGASVGSPGKNEENRATSPDPKKATNDDEK